MLSLFWSLLPQAVLGHDIKAAPIIGGLYLLLASTYLTKKFRTRELLFALLVLPVFVLFAYDNSLIPISILCLLFVPLVYVLTPSLIISQKSFYLLLGVGAAYCSYFLIFQFENSFGFRTIGFFSENDLLGKFALNFGFASPARFAALATALLIFCYVNLTPGRKKQYVLALLLIMLILSLNRISLMFVLVLGAVLVIRRFAWFRPLASVASIFVVGVSVLIMLALPTLFPILERLDRVLAIFLLTPTWDSIDYFKYVEQVVDPQILVSADFLWALLQLNFGTSGIILSAVVATALLIHVRSNGHNGIIVLYLLLVGWKNWQMNIDPVIFTAILLTKMRLSDEQPKNANNMVAQT